MKIIFTILALLSFAFAAITFAAGKETSNDSVSANITLKAIRLTEKISLDGILSESVWNNGYGLSQFVQRDPVQGSNPTEKSVVHLAYDDEALYVGAKLFDSAPDSIVARLSRKDNWVSSDQFLFFIDPYFDKRTGYYFAINAAGTLYDGILLNDDWDDNSWDGVWEGKVNRDSTGWTAEMKIPYSQLRFVKKDIYTWGVNFKRVIERKNESDYITYTPKNGSGFVSRFIKLEGIQNINPRSSFEILPYVTTRAEYLQHSDGDPYNDGSTYVPGMGVDFKIGLGSNLTLNATVNPDFGQVEVDPAVVNLSDVETYFNEKRPFFLEGSSIFEFGFGGANNYWGFNWAGPSLFYSRRIGRNPQGSIPDNDFIDRPDGTHILGAAKLSGKIANGWNIGAITSFTKREFARTQYNGIKSETEIEPFSHYGIYRVQKDFNDAKQGLGFMATASNRFFKDTHLENDINRNAYAFGIDGWTFLDSSKVWVISGWAAASHIMGSKQRMINVQENPIHYFQRPDADYVNVDSSANSLTGYGARLYLNKQKGNTYVNAAIGVLDPKFDVNDAGFMWRTDAVNMHVVGGYRWTEEGSFYRRINLHAALFRNYNFGGNITWEGFYHSGYFQFLNYYQMNWWYAYNPETTNPRRTRGGPLTKNHSGWETGFFASSDARKPWVFTGNANTYQTKDGVSRYFSIGIEWKPVSNLSVQLNPDVTFDNTTEQYVGVFDDTYAQHTYGKRYVFAHLYQTTISAGIRLNWTFTPKLSFQLYMQPLLSTGNYFDFRELSQPGTYNYHIYGRDNTTIRKEDSEYVVDPDAEGAAQEFRFDDPDFNFKSLRGNAVLRWEYLPGSILYFVWTQSRSDYENVGTFNFSRSFKKLLDRRSDNIFMIKFTYWFNI